MHSSAINQPSSERNSIVRRSPFVVLVLSMIASWLLGDQGTLRSLANYLHLMDIGTTFDQSVAQDQQRAMLNMYIGMGTIPQSSFVLSQAGNEEWALVHWQVVLRLLARVQSLARLQPLRDLYRLTPEEALLPSVPLFFDSPCHIDRIQTDYSLARSANIQKPARNNSRNLRPGASRRPYGISGRCCRQLL